MTDTPELERIADALRKQQHDAVLSACHAYEESTKPAPFNQMVDAIAAYLAALRTTPAADAALRVAAQAYIDAEETEAKASKENGDG